MQSDALHEATRLRLPNATRHAFRASRDSAKRLAQAREVTKVQRAQNAEKRQQHEEEVQRHHEKVEFEASAKNADEEDVRQLYEASQARIATQLDEAKAKAVRGATKRGP